MHYLKTNFIQLFFMLIALGLLCYGYFNEDALVLAVSSILPILVWFIDKIISIKKERTMDSERSNTNKKINIIEDILKWK